MIGSALKQLGLPYTLWSGTATIAHDVVTGTATRYDQANGLSILLLDCQVKSPFSINTPVEASSSVTLCATISWLTSKQPTNFHLTASPTAWKLFPNQRYCLYVIVFGQSWLQENILTNSPLSELETNLQQLLIQDALLVQLIRQETEKLPEHYHQQALDPLFVWKVTYTILWQLFDRLHQQRHSSRYTVADQQRVETVHQYLINNLSNSSISVSALAQMANMSLTKFNRLFKEIYSASVRDFIAEKRLQVARELLATHQYTISQVALKVGFTNASGLTKLFQKKYGISPKSI